ncbi:hypothetical protein KVF89_20965 [Nocardioides carbamazepini]|uniref:hypothetical protein n=1 Tax=Nocardioides carbamazepini TaxID=2854259 RepID=UPI00214A7A2D|nr:hypothetical protein [Nocardioides carbamazepini]MCR1785023.1 hypothetical protein [Nocardioides carbamazepini]
MRKKMIAVTTVVLLATTAGCGFTPAAEKRSAPGPQGAPTALTEGASSVLSRLREGLNYVVYPSPDKLVEERGAAYVGEVHEIREGRTLLSKTDGGWTRDNSVVITVRVTRELRELQGASADGMIYVSMPRGVNAVTTDGKIMGSDPHPSIEELRRSLPNGLKVLVMAGAMDPGLALSNPSTRVEKDPRIVPGEALLLDGFHPQTVVFDQGTEPLDAWADYTFNELVAAATD